MPRITEVDIRHLERDVIERAKIGLGEHDRAVIGAGAAQKPERRILVDHLKAERPGEEPQACIEVAGIEIDVRYLARTIGIVVDVRMVGTTAHEREVAAIRVLAAESVAAAWERQLRRPAGRATRRQDCLMQGAHPLPIGDIEHDADQRRLRPAVETEDVVVSVRYRGAAACPYALHRTQTPHALVEPSGLRQIGGDDLDAAHAADRALRHARHSPASSPFTNPEALPKSILPA